MSTEVLLEVRKLSKIFPRRGRLGPKSALRGVSFTLDRADSLGVVGLSGSGKSTLARCLAGFEPPTAGEIVFAGRTLGIQMIQQQPAASLNPRFTAKEIIEEPLVIQRRTPGDAAARMLDVVQLPAGSLTRRAHEFSGGERQRLAIARALVLEPELLILDESFAGLDPARQHQICSLLRDLQRRLGVSYLLISHDLSLVTDLAREIAVLHEGEIVERLPAGSLAGSAAHPLTRELVAATQAISPDGLRA